MYLSTMYIAPPPPPNLGIKHIQCSRQICSISWKKLAKKHLLNFELQLCICLSHKVEINCRKSVIRLDSRNQLSGKQLTARPSIMPLLESQSVELCQGIFNLGYVINTVVGLYCVFSLM